MERKGHVRGSNEYFFICYEYFYSLRAFAYFWIHFELALRGGQFRTRGSVGGLEGKIFSRTNFFSLFIGERS